MAKKTNFKNKSGNKYFRTSAVVGHKPDGKPIQKQFYGSSKKEAEEKKQQYLLGINQGLSQDFDKTMFKSIFDLWFFEVKKPHVKKNTFKVYMVEYNKRIVTSEIYSMKMVDVKNLHIQRLINQISKEYNSEIAGKTLALLKTFYTYCEAERIVDRNIATHVRIPNDSTVKEETDYQILEKEDIKKLENYADNNSYGNMYVFAIYSGLRQGEILALTHDDIDLENDTIRVNKTLVYVKDDKGKMQLEVTSPKSKYSIREVPINDKLKKYIKTQIKAEKEKHMRLGMTFSNSQPLFSSELCQHQYASNVLFYWKKTIQELGIEYIKFHALRHTFCSLLAEKEVYPMTAAKLMGHGSTREVEKVYTHIMMKQKREAVNKLNDVIEN
jgi:integrase